MIQDHRAGKSASAKTLQDPGVVIETQKLYAEFLSFLAQCGGNVVSSSSAAQTVYEKWLKICRFQEHEAHLYTTIKDLHVLVTDVFLIKNQQRLDFLALILGVLGAMALVNVRITTHDP